MLQVIRDKLRPLIMRKYSASRRGAHQMAVEAGMSPRERKLFMSGFEQGWMCGAKDTTAVTAQDLRRPEETESPSDVH